ncbi:transcriptional regulator, ArsR family [Glycomyces sambucus]|jgi:DNA-binding transcriptional ArsR family regulator|uniref:Transcriptional regulator, ArsR family n=1 Tax=Glycomyces sambucus TaxID=380244 RepID=A0A1G9E4L3_9ACTN|nr:transcriptional regulator, ArsR family [Glycomyces sambucus]
MTARTPGTSPEGATRYFCGVRTEAEPTEAPADYESAGELLRALAAPLRIAIVMELAAGPKYVHQIVETLGVTQPLVSQHLRVLRGAGIVRGTRSGREISYSLIDDHIAHIVTDAVNHAREEH